MKNKTLKYNLLICLSLLLFLLSGCKKEVESLTVTPNSIVLAVGDQYPLKSDVQPKKAPASMAATT